MHPRFGQLAQLALGLGTRQRFVAQAFFFSSALFGDRRGSMLRLGAGLRLLQGHLFGGQAGAVKHLGTRGFVLRQFFCVAQGGRQPGEFTGGGVRTRGGSVLSGGLAFSHLLRFALGCRMFFSGSGGGTLGFEFFLRFAQRVMFGFAARQRLITQFRFRSETCTCSLGRRLVGAGTKFEFLARGMFSLGALGGTGARMGFPGQTCVSGMAGAGFRLGACNRLLDGGQLAAVSLMGGVNNRLGKRFLFPLMSNYQAGLGGWHGVTFGRRNRNTGRVARLLTIMAARFRPNPLKRRRFAVQFRRSKP